MGLVITLRIILLNRNTISFLSSLLLPKASPSYIYCQVILANRTGNKTQKYQYNNNGLYAAKLEVMDSETLIEEITQTVIKSNSGETASTYSDPRNGKTYPTIKI